MAKKPDRRTARTKAALMTAFVDLVLAGGYDAVTVEGVAERANVGRSTFYIHYAGKEDILRQSMARPSSFLAVIVGHDVAPDIIIHILDHFREQRARNGAFFAPPIRALWVTALSELIEPRLAKLIRQFRLRPILAVPLIARQIAEAQIALITGWILDRSPAKAEPIAEALIASTRALVSALLRAPQDTALFIAGEKLQVIHR